MSATEFAAACGVAAGIEVHAPPWRNELAILPPCMCFTSLRQRIMPSGLAVWPLDHTVNIKGYCYPVLASQKPKEEQ
jgi:hypothetical protein